MRVFAPVLFAVLALSLSTGVSSQPSTPANVVCFQEIVGSNSNYAAVSASIAAWAGKLQSALSLSGDVHTYADWAQVPDRNSFENGCDGPYATVADVFVHIQATGDNFDTLSAELEAFVAANPWTAQPNIACGARSVVTYLPGCGKVPTPPPTAAPTRANNPTQSGPTTPPATSAPTRANNPTSPPAPANVVCYQAIVGSSATQAQVETSIAAWAALLESSLGLSGDVHQFADWALVPDRTSFENGCNGPYSTVEDVFVHIQTTADNFASVSAQLEAFVAAHPITDQPNIACAARSVTTFLPTCGQAPTQAPTRANNPTQAPTQAPTKAPTQAPTKAPTQAPTKAPTEAPTQAPTRANNPTQAPTGSPSRLCYQEIIGSNSDFGTVQSSIGAWAAKLETALGLSGDIHQFADWSQVTDRNSFEGCAGPYSTVADVFVHVDTTSDAYDALSAKLEAFVAANPWTSQPNIACAARSVVTFIPGCGKTPAGTQAPTRANSPTQAPTQNSTSAPTNSSTPTRANNPTQAPGSPTELPSPNNILCYQEIVGSNSNYTAVSASIGAWAAKLEAALGLSGDVHQYVDWAQVPDRNSFEGGCNGPYTTVADVFVHIDTTSQAFDGLSAQLEAFVAANPWNSQPNIACGARSVVTYIPGCGKLQTGPNPAATTAPPATQAPTSAPTTAGTTAPTTAPTSAPTTAGTSAPTSGPSSAPTPANVVCYQAVFGSNSNFSVVSADVAAWAAKLEAALGLSGDVHQYVDWAQVTDRNSFDSCPGPYATVADVFVHIQATSANFDSLSMQLESWLLANPLTANPDIACASRSVTTNLPTCGKVPSGGAPPNGGSTGGMVCYQSIVGSLNGTYTQVSAELAAWAAKLESALGLSGDVHQYVDWAQVPDRTSFENGCNGPYATVADIFVHINTTDFTTVSANVASFVASNSLVSSSNGGVINCAASSVTTNIPICGPTSVSSQAASTDQSSSQQSSTNGAATATITGSLMVTLIASTLYLLRY